MKLMDLVSSSEHTEIYRLETEPFGTNSYVVSCKDSKKAVLIDAPGGKDVITDQFKDVDFQFILMTHGHGDHTMVLEELFEELEAPVAVHKGDSDMLPLKPHHLLKNGDLFECGEEKMQVIHTPGHTAGSLCYYIGNYLISGDTLFPGGPGKTDSPKDFKTIITSISEKLLKLPDETIVLPGHGEQTTIGKERKLIENFISKGFSDQLFGEITWE